MDARLWTWFNGWAFHWEKGPWHTLLISAKLTSCNNNLLRTDMNRTSFISEESSAKGKSEFLNIINYKDPCRKIGTFNGSLWDIQSLLKLLSILYLLYLIGWKACLKYFVGTWASFCFINNYSDIKKAIFVKKFWRTLQESLMRTWINHSTAGRL